VKRYVPPTDDEPLDQIQWAIVRALVPVIAETIRQQLIAEYESLNDDTRNEALAGNQGRR
jgi:hypothetical protein